MLSYSVIRIHAGLYISADGTYRVKRRMDMLKRRCVWDVSRLSDGQFSVQRTFNTLKVAREYVDAALVDAARLF